MKPALRLGAAFYVPIDVVTSTLIVYGGKGMGKTNFGAVCSPKSFLKTIFAGVCSICNRIANGEYTWSTAGRDAMSENVERLPTGRDLLQYWLDKLPTGEAALLQVLVTMSQTAEELAESTKYALSSLRTYLGKLSRRELVIQGPERRYGLPKELR